MGQAKKSLPRGETENRVGHNQGASEKQIPNVKIWEWVSFLLLFFSFLFFPFYPFFFWLHLRHMEVPGPGIKLVPQSAAAMLDPHCATREFPSFILKQFCLESLNMKSSFISEFMSLLDLRQKLVSHNRVLSGTKIK